MPWPEVKLGDLFKVKHGFAFKGAHFSSRPGALVLTPGNFEAGGGLKLRPGKDRSYDAACPSEFVLKPGDLLVVMTDLTQEAAILGAPAFVPLGVPCLHNQRLGKIVDLEEGRIDRRFLYYIFNSQGYRERLKATSTGATVRHTSPSRIYEHVVNLPPLEAQRRIASVLGAYDDLIEVNRRRIAILEEMARGLFEEWFVHFRFPDAEKAVDVETPDGRLPEGWRVTELGNILRLHYGKALKAETRIPGPVAVIGSSGVVGSHTSRLIDGPGIVVGRKGNVGSVIWSTGDFWPIDTAYFVETELPLTFAYELLRRIPFQNTDAAVPGLNRDYAQSMRVVVPPTELAKRYGAFALPVRRHRDALEQANEKLSTARDLLLPRLISGQLSLEAAERQLEDAA